MTTGSKNGKSPSVSGRRKSTSKGALEMTLNGVARHSVVTGPRSRDPNNPKLDEAEVKEIVIHNK